MKVKTATVTGPKRSGGGGRRSNKLGYQLAQNLIQHHADNHDKPDAYQRVAFDKADLENQTGETTTEQTYKLSNNLQQQIERCIGFKIDRITKHNDLKDNEIFMRFTEERSSRFDKNPAAVDYYNGILAKWRGKNKARKDKTPPQADTMAAMLAFYRVRCGM